MNYPKNEILQHVEWFVVLTALVGGFFLISTQIEHQSSRTDRLYEMFIDLLKEERK